MSPVICSGERDFAAAASFWAVEKLNGFRFGPTVDDLWCFLVLNRTLGEMEFVRAGGCIFDSSESFTLSIEIVFGAFAVLKIAEHRVVGDQR